MTAYQLKWIAIVTMVIDHVGLLLFPEYIVFRIVGRLAFPIFAFLLVNGYTHTSNYYKYLARLFGFGLISEPIYDYVVYGQLNINHQNIFFTLALGLLSIEVLKNYRTDAKRYWIQGLFLVIGELLGFDYGMYGILTIWVFYYFKNQPKKIWLYFGGLNIAFVVPIILGMSHQYGALIQSFSILAVAIIGLYNNQKGKSMKYFFYVFYPLHFVVIWCIKNLI